MCFHTDPSLALVSAPGEDVGRKEALPFTKAQAPPGANHSLGRRQKLWFPWQRRQRPLSTAISWSRDMDCTPPHPDGALLSFSHQEGTGPNPSGSVPNPQPRLCRSGKGCGWASAWGLGKIAETRPVCGGPLSPGVCLSVGTGACVHRCSSPRCSSKRQCQLQKQESLEPEGRHPAPAQLWHQFTTGSEQVSSALSWGLLFPRL